jgi:hypothetical protein
VVGSTRHAAAGRQRHNSESVRTPAPGSWPPRRVLGHCGERRNGRARARRSLHTT